MNYQVKEYLDTRGRSPFRLWLDTLDIAVRARVQARVLRFEYGNLGDCRSVGDGVMEARLTFGPGYRVYFGVVGRQVVLLLTGGDKRTQSKDIMRAKQYWTEYREAADGEAK